MQCLRRQQMRLMLAGMRVVASQGAARAASGAHARACCSPQPLPVVLLRQQLQLRCAVSSTSQRAEPSALLQARTTATSAVRARAPVGGLRWSVRGVVTACASHSSGSRGSGAAQHQQPQRTMVEGNGSVTLLPKEVWAIEGRQRTPLLKVPGWHPHVKL